MHHPDVYLGSIRPYEGSRPSAIEKRLVEGALNLTPLGLAGDEQAEKSYHGGPDRALCHYSREHYDHWREQFPTQAEQFCAPAFGENISTFGLTEHNVFMGDIFRWGEALIQVTQPRSPCFKLNYHFAIADMSVLMQQTGRCGWLYRVVSTGMVSGDQPLELVTRNSEVSVAEAIGIAWHMPFDEEQYRRLLSVAGLSASWSKTMLTRIASGKIEDFNRRLLGR
ncbi:MAG: 6-hydroxyaminopurine reductase [Enterobacterales bacterium]|uniref:6-hydroxyaminopurine reductase n=1 Tax=Serratia sp. (in: enterobacteria) TaxID=616 RepID=UPI003F3AFE3B